ncbi:SagB/ThcOx family dehydrogenase [Paenibacillus apiarius]|uniref:SagB/ThcOx family dehydrogenase n=1 Tax=Paenibacillus apiarius TaxID=46240 RepID=UPI00198036C0|nr:SagB/ThcOx family dehydrogenase [Paenibacillus apiarius]MBN3526497.1 SagB/ThcOx family dehydrogenase [Paenibacillus apiarius]
MQQQAIKRFEKTFHDELYFWSPSVGWEMKEGQIRIERLTYSDTVTDLFPAFYFITQQGVKITDVINRFPDVNPDKLTAFIKDLIKNKILVDKLLTPQELYYSQSKILPNPYDEETFIHPEKYEAFKKKQLSRSYQNVADYSLELIDGELPEEISRRKSYRKFDENTKIPFEAFSLLLSAFKQNTKNNCISYHYATAGGLYPIDLFVYVKDHRVEKVRAGLYYYNPISNALQLVSNTCVITDEAHYFANKEIFKSSAMSVFMIYDASVTMPKYGGMGYYFAGIDAGIMVQLLTQVAELNHLGLCSIGEMNFRKIEKYFKLTPAHVLIHSVEVGLKPEMKERGKTEGKVHFE